MFFSRNAFSCLWMSETEFAECPASFASHGTNFPHLINVQNFYYLYKLSSQC
jgi:hypothetical protein